MSPLEFVMNDPAPLRRVLKRLIARAGIGSFAFRYRIEALQRMHYAYILYEGAKLAAALGQKRISAIEFGVAGGNGLLWLERHAEAIERLFPVEIEIYGFDTGGGLPKPKDYRDLPHHWQGGFFAMDRDRLEKKLKRAKLVIGDVAETWKSFVADHSPAPVAAVSHDLDFYSSTVDGLKLFGIDPAHLMPRIFCYFDDTVGGDMELYSDFTGERLAINDFNAAHEHRKIGVPYYLRCQEGLGLWRHQIWVCHLFDHPRYNDFISEPGQQLPLAR